MAVLSLKEWREQNDKTQGDVAGVLGVAPRTISHIEGGGNTTFANLKAIYDLTDGQVTPNMIVLGKPA